MSWQDSTNTLEPQLSLLSLANLKFRSLESSMYEILAVGTSLPGVYNAMPELRIIAAAYSKLIRSAGTSLKPKILKAVSSSTNLT